MKKCESIFPSRKSTGRGRFSLFLGIDLAWSNKNNTGVTILQGDEKKARHVDSRILHSDDEIVDYVLRQVGKQNALIAIDAPLIVPNEEGRRPAEDLVQMLFGKYHAGAYPANRKHMSEWTGKIRGEEISRLLEKQSFIHDPLIRRYEQTRKFFEVYPHPSMVVLFDLEKVIPYKSKPNRDYAFRWNAFREYQNNLRKLERAKPSMILPKEILEKNVNELRARKLKDYEDMLDSIFCAYIAYYTWANPGKCEVLGSMKEGYILTPIFDSMRNQLKTAKV